MIPIPQAQTSASGGAICIVAPSTRERSALTRLLGELGPAIIGWSSAEKFLEELSEQGPSCIIADIDLPGLSGLELLAELRSRRLQAPMIFIGAQGSVGAAVQALRAGARDYFERPLRSRALYKAVAAIVRTRPGTGGANRAHSKQASNL